MAFFDNLARMVIDFITGTLNFLIHIAGVVINSTFGWFTGQTIDEGIAALFLYGMFIFAGGAWMFFGKALKFKQ